jgi:tetratricopeptide (TPR) repeat protein
LIRHLATIFIQDHPEDGRGLWALGIVRMHQRDYEAAQDLFQEASRAAENPLGYDAHNALIATLDRKAGLGDRAFAGYQKVLAEAPYGGHAYVTACVGMAELGYIATGIKGLELSVREEGGHQARAYFELGRLYAATDRHEDAIDVVEKALALSGTQVAEDLLADLLEVVGRSSPTLEAHLKAKKPRRKAPARRKRVAEPAAA